jgi:hypothetical protein
LTGTEEELLRDAIFRRIWASEVHLDISPDDRILQQFSAKPEFGIRHIKVHVTYNELRLNIHKTLSST